MAPKRRRNVDELRRNYAETEIRRAQQQEQSRNSPGPVIQEGEYHRQDPFQAESTETLRPDDSPMLPRSRSHTPAPTTEWDGRLFPEGTAPDFPPTTGTPSMPPPTPRAKPRPRSRQTQPDPEATVPPGMTDIRTDYPLWLAYQHVIASLNNPTSFLRAETHGRIPDLSLPEPRNYVLVLLQYAAIQRHLEIQRRTGILYVAPAEVLALPGGVRGRDPFPAADLFLRETVVNHMPRNLYRWRHLVQRQIFREDDVPWNDADGLPSGLALSNILQTEGSATDLGYLLFLVEYPDPATGLPTYRLLDNNPPPHHPVPRTLTEWEALSPPDNNPIQVHLLHMIREWRQHVESIVDSVARTEHLRFDNLRISIPHTSPYWVPNLPTSVNRGMFFHTNPPTEVMWLYGQHVWRFLRELAPDRYGSVPYPHGPPLLLRRHDDGRFEDLFATHYEGSTDDPGRGNRAVQFHPFGATEPTHVDTRDTVEVTDVDTQPEPESEPIPETEVVDVEMTEGAAVADIPAPLHVVRYGINGYTPDHPGVVNACFWRSVHFYLSDSRRRGNEPARLDEFVEHYWTFLQRHMPVTDQRALLLRFGEGRTWMQLVRDEQNQMNTPIPGRPYGIRGNVLNYYANEFHVETMARVLNLRIAIFRVGTDGRPIPAATQVVGSVDRPIGPLLLNEGESHFDALRLVPGQDRTLEAVWAQIDAIEGRHKANAHLFQVRPETIPHIRSNRDTTTPDILDEHRRLPVRPPTPSFDPEPEDTGPRDDPLSHPPGRTEILSDRHDTPRDIPSSSTDDLDPHADIRALFRAYFTRAGQLGMKPWKRGPGASHTLLGEKTYKNTDGTESDNIYHNLSTATRDPAHRAIYEQMYDEYLQANRNRTLRTATQVNWSSTQWNQTHGLPSRLLARFYANQFDLAIQAQSAPGRATRNTPGRPASPTRFMIVDDHILTDDSDDTAGSSGSSSPSGSSRGGRGPGGGDGSVSSSAPSSPSPSRPPSDAGVPSPPRSPAPLRSPSLPHRVVPTTQDTAMVTDDNGELRDNIEDMVRDYSELEHAYREQARALQGMIQERLTTEEAYHRHVRELEEEYERHDIRWREAHSTNMTDIHRMADQHIQVAAHRNRMRAEQQALQEAERTARGDIAEQAGESHIRMLLQGMQQPQEATALRMQIAELNRQHTERRRQDNEAYRQLADQMATTEGRLHLAQRQLEESAIVNTELRRALDGFAIERQRYEQLAQQYQQSVNGTLGDLGARNTHLHQQAAAMAAQLDTTLRHARTLEERLGQEQTQHRVTHDLLQETRDRETRANQDAHRQLHLLLTEGESRERRELLAHEAETRNIFELYRTLPQPTPQSRPTTSTTGTSTAAPPTTTDNATSTRPPPISTSPTPSTPLASTTPTPHVPSPYRGSPVSISSIGGRSPVETPRVPSAPPSPTMLSPVVSRMPSPVILSPLPSPLTLSPVTGTPRSAPPSPAITVSSRRSSASTVLSSPAASVKAESVAVSIHSEAGYGQRVDTTPTPSPPGSDHSGGSIPGTPPATPPPSGGGPPPTRTTATYPSIYPSPPSTPSPRSPPHTPAPSESEPPMFNPFRGIFGGGPPATPPGSVYGTPPVSVVSNMSYQSALGDPEPFAGLYGDKRGQGRSFDVAGDILDPRRCRHKLFGDIRNALIGTVRPDPRMPRDAGAVIPRRFVS